MEPGTLVTIIFSGLSTAIGALVLFILANLSQRIGNLETLHSGDGCGLVRALADRVDRLERQAEGD